MKNPFRALVSVFNKDNLYPFVYELRELDCEFISTGGTAKFLREGGIHVTDVSEITGFPECFDGRVKTLHPKVHGGLLYRSDKPDHVTTAAKLNIDRIDILVVNLYPFRETVARPGVTFDDAIEQIDIGGPAMIRAAAKNHQNVIVICDPADYGWILIELKQTGDISKEHRLALAQKVFALMSDYDGAIDQYLGTQTGRTTEHLHLAGGRELAYAENRCQSPAFIYSDGGDNPLAMSKFQVVAGNPSFIAMADASQLVSLMCLMSECFWRSCEKVPYIAIVGKHGNPCGAAVDWDLRAVAAQKALMGDPVAAMGGELITNFRIDNNLGLAIHHADKAKIGREYWGLDEVLAPDISPITIDLLGKKAKRRLLINPALDNPPFPKEEWTYRELLGGDWLKQKPHRFVFAPDQVVHWIGAPFKDQRLDDAIIAFACCWRAASNTVALAKERQLIGLGCGQQDRIACVRLALDRASRAGHNAVGSVFASDGFFPYANSTPPDEKKIASVKASCAIINEQLDDVDAKTQAKMLADLAYEIDRLDRREGPELLRDAGCVGGIVPADGKELENVIRFFAEANMRVAFVAPENRGFAKH